ncbi:glucan endo-1,3-beta-glucosidase 5 [Beta vulgaris subsp. vulgaris]|uniref:glucan endo-1,3-beta-glucosidase 5 n=1 Tax=Beta vulgaris subsp. vulgaris TaxID=3555 RepID=UPI0020370C9E|nr:glucan endo-1,3-beta-glucosidase 5 [Beta vulgaris subsp. vulgaris]
MGKKKTMSGCFCLYGEVRCMIGTMGLILMVMMMGVDGNSIGANWGTQATHPLDGEIVVQMLKDNGISKVKLFEPDVNALKALGKSGVEVMIGIPNDLLAALSTDVSAAEKWVSKNLSSYVSSHGVNVRYVAVGNEPFLKTLNGTYDAMTLPALQNIQSALIKAGLANQVKVTIPLNADVYQTSSNVPSGGDFRSDINDLMLKIVKFLNDNACPITINIYPFISLYNDPNFPADYAFFDGFSSPLDDNGKTYTNVFDANYDTLVWSLQKNGFPNMSIIVGEIGWPTDGDNNANPTTARRFNQGLVNHLSAGKGTPMRPSGPIDVYLFSLIDEDDKSILPGNFERHWGIFNYDGTPKYQLNLGLAKIGSVMPAKGVQYLEKKWCVMSSSANLTDPQIASSVSYACERADCTSLGDGTSCSNLDVQGNISYAFNSYYQEQNQQDKACQFPNGLSTITTKDPSSGTCRFIVQIKSETSSRLSSSAGHGSGLRSGSVKAPVSFVALVFIIVITIL